MASPPFLPSNLPFLPSTPSLLHSPHLHLHLHLHLHRAFPTPFRGLAVAAALLASRFSSATCLPTHRCLSTPLQSIHLPLNLMGEPQNASSPICDETEELERLEHAPPFWTQTKSRKRLSKQLSMHSRVWERRRRRILVQERRQMNSGSGGDDKLTDDDLKELKGCIELGFGFKEESGQQLCPTIPALDLYFAVNRQVWTAASPLNSPSSSSSSSSGSPMSDSESSWKIFNPGNLASSTFPIHHQPKTSNSSK